MNLKEWTGLSGWLYENPSKGVIFLLVIGVMVEGFVITNLNTKIGRKDGKIAIYERQLENCNDKMHENEAEFRRLLIQLIEVRQRVDSVSDKADKVIDEAQKTIKNVKKKI